MAHEWMRYLRFSPVNSYTCVHHDEKDPLLFSEDEDAQNLKFSFRTTTTISTILWQQSSFSLGGLVGRAYLPLKKLDFFLRLLFLQCCWVVDDEL